MRGHLNSTMNKGSVTAAADERRARALRLLREMYDAQRTAVDASLASSATERDVMQSILLRTHQEKRDAVEAEYQAEMDRISRHY